MYEVNFKQFHHNNNGRNDKQKQSNFVVFVANILHLKTDFVLNFCVAYEQKHINNFEFRSLKVGGNWHPLCGDGFIITFLNINLKYVICNKIVSGALFKI